MPRLFFAVLLRKIATGEFANALCANRDRYIRWIAVLWRQYCDHYLSMPLLAIAEIFMSYQLINETRLMIEQIIDNILMAFASDHPFRQALSVPLLRHQLTAKVLNKIPNRHSVYGDGLCRTVPAVDFAGMIKERSFVEAEIRNLLPTLVDNAKHPQAVRPDLAPRPITPPLQIHDQAWWIKVHTLMPCATYYFGPFDSRTEAKAHYPGYFADLKSEKAIGISARLEFTKPIFLTLIDAPEDLKRDQQRLWRLLKRLYPQKSAMQKRLANHWNVLPGVFLGVDFDGTIKDANQRACHLFNTDLDHLIGQSIFFFVPQPHIFLLAERMGMMASDQDEWVTPYRWSMQLQVVNFDPILVDVEATQAKNDRGSVVGWYWSLHDLSSPEN